MKKIPFLIFIIISLGLFISAPIYAERIASYPKENRLEDRQEKIQNLKNAAKEKRCTIITQNITRLIERYNTTHTHQIDRYNKIKENLRKAVTRLNELGYDTSKVAQSLEVLNQMIVDYDSIHTKFEAALNSTSGLACGESNGVYVNKVKEAQDYLKQMRAKAKEIENYYKENVRSEIQNLKSQKPSKKTQ
jgi:hypothetical protein